MSLTRAEQEFLERRALPYFGIRRAVAVVDVGAGDIAYTAHPRPTILLGPGFRQTRGAARRRKLVHELLHAVGIRHDGRARARGYYSAPDRDELSRRVYADLLRGSQRFDPRRWGLEVGR